MSFFDCVQEAMDGGEADRDLGRRAQDEWRKRSDQYEAQGHQRHMAEALAAQDVKEAFKREAGETRHVYLSRIANMRKQQAEVNAAAAPDMAKRMEKVEMQHRSMLRWANGRLGAFLQEHHRDILGNVTKPEQLLDIVRSLVGEAVGSPVAKAMAESVRALNRDLRLMFNEAGGLIDELDDWGLPHRHDRTAIMKAGKEAWSARIAGDIDWTRVRDPLTGRPMQAKDGPAPPRDAQMSFLSEVYDNIAFGKDSREAVYGRPQGVATYRKHAHHRVLHFKNADAWIAYNREFGSGDPFASIMGHVHRMARDITLMREFGPNPGLGAEYRAQLWEAKARGDQEMTEKAASDRWLALRILKVLDGGNVPRTASQHMWATFFSSARHVMTAAFLDRAIIASVSDINSMRLAASAVGMKPENLISRHMSLLGSGMARDEALRAGWVADTLADAGAALARFQQEMPPAIWAERLASASMRVQGLAHWTDSGRMAFQMEMGGLMASQAGKPLRDVDGPIGKLLRDAGVTEAEWAELTNPENMFKADNGATFVSPMYWRAATTMPDAQADRLFLKVQSMVEDQLEYAVPTQSILARGYVDPAAMDLEPGTFWYEVMKSGLMFKSFAMTFTINQVRRISSQATPAGKLGYAFNLAAGATIMGALALQIGELVAGRDPQNMNPATEPEFWVRAALKGGGFGIMGDLLVAGQTSFGGGLAQYAMGPMPQLAQDAYALTFMNAWQAATGQETNFAMELGRAIKRYTPMAQTPAIGPAFDRIFADNLIQFLDPEAGDALVDAARRGQNMFGRGDDWWLPGKSAPSRLPNIGAAWQ